MTGRVGPARRFRAAVGVAVISVVAVTACQPGYPTPAPGPGWARYRIVTGAHSAAVNRPPAAPRPLAGFTTEAGRGYWFVFNPTARYRIVDPVEPGDQLDWNKLPGLSDCGTPDLSVNGFMFAWRWRTDLVPRRLEIGAYANNNSSHLTAPTPMVTLTAAQLTAPHPIWFRMRISDDRESYEFRTNVTVNGRDVRAFRRLPRACRTARTATKWASGLYFGGTSTAPTDITGHIHEP